MGTGTLHTFLPSQTNKVADELGPLYEDGCMVYHALLKKEVRVKVGVVACPNDSRAHEKLAWFNPSGAKVCCWLCRHNGLHEPQYSKMLYPIKARDHLPAGHPWKAHPFFGPAAAAAQPTLRSMRSITDAADRRTRYLDGGGREGGNDDPCKTTGVKGRAEVWRLPGMNDPERLPADFMHSVAQMASGITQVVKGQVLKGKTATKGDLYDVEKRARGSWQTHFSHTTICTTSRTTVHTTSCTACCIGCCTDSCICFCTDSCIDVCINWCSDASCTCTCAS